MQVGNCIVVISGVFRGALGKIRVVETNGTVLVTFDEPALCLDEIHFTPSEIKVL